MSLLSGLLGHRRNGLDSGGAAVDVVGAGPSSGRLWRSQAWTQSPGVQSKPAWLGQQSPASAAGYWASTGSMPNLRNQPGNQKKQQRKQQQEVLTANGSGLRRHDSDLDSLSDFSLSPPPQSYATQPRPLPPEQQPHYSQQQYPIATYNNLHQRNQSLVTVPPPPQQQQQQPETFFFNFGQSSNAVAQQQQRRQQQQQQVPHDYPKPSPTTSSAVWSRADARPVDTGSNSAIGPQGQYNDSHRNSGAGVIREVGIVKPSVRTETQSDIILDSDISASIGILDQILDLYDDDDSTNNEIFVGTAGFDTSQRPSESAYGVVIDSFAKSAERNMIVRRPPQQTSASVVTNSIHVVNEEEEQEQEIEIQHTGQIVAVRQHQEIYVRNKTPGVAHNAVAVRQSSSAPVVFAQSTDTVYEEYLPAQRNDDHLTSRDSNTTKSASVSNGFAASNSVRSGGGVATSASDNTNRSSRSNGWSMSNFDGASSVTMAMDRRNSNSSSDSTLSASSQNASRSGHRATTASYYEELPNVPPVPGAVETLHRRGSVQSHPPALFIPQPPVQFSSSPTEPDSSEYANFESFAYGYQPVPHHPGFAAPSSPMKLILESPVHDGSKPPQTLPKRWKTADVNVNSSSGDQNNNTKSASFNVSLAQGFLLTQRPPANDSLSPPPPPAVNSVHQPLPPLPPPSFSSGSAQTLPAANPSLPPPPPQFSTIPTPPVPPTPPSYQTLPPPPSHSTVSPRFIPPPPPPSEAVVQAQALVQNDHSSAGDFERQNSKEATVSPTIRRTQPPPTPQRTSTLRSKSSQSLAPDPPQHAVQPPPPPPPPPLPPPPPPANFAVSQSVSSPVPPPAPSARSTASSEDGPQSSAAVGGTLLDASEGFVSLPPPPEDFAADDLTADFIPPPPVLPQQLPIETSSTSEVDDERITPAGGLAAALAAAAFKLRSTPQQSDQQKPRTSVSATQNDSLSAIINQLQGGVKLRSTNLGQRIRGQDSSTETNGNQQQSSPVILRRSSIVDNTSGSSPVTDRRKSPAVPPPTLPKPAAMSYPDQVASSDEFPAWKRAVLDRRNSQKFSETKRDEAKNTDEDKWKGVPEWKRNLLMKKAEQGQRN